MDVRIIMCCQVAQGRKAFMRMSFGISSHIIPCANITFGIFKQWFRFLYSGSVS